MSEPAEQIEAVLRHNREWSAAVEPAELPPAPARGLAVVTCMDCRLRVDEAFGLQPGEAHVMRNAGGVVTDDMLRSLAISQRKLGTREVAVVHHTRCGMQTITDDGFRAELLAETGVAPAWAVEAFADLEEDVRQSVRRVRRSPFLLHVDAVRGFVYDVDAHTLTEVAD